MHGRDLAVQPFEHCCAVVIQAQHIHRCSPTFVLEHHCIQRGNRRCIPHVSPGKIDDDPRRILGVLELADQVIARCEEQLSVYFVRDVITVRSHNARHGDQVRHASSEEDCGRQDASDNADGQIVSEHSGDNRRQYLSQQ